MLENIRLAFQGIWSHKMRSVLTMLGIIIGIAAIITIVSTIKGTNEQIKENLIGAGNNVVTVQLNQGDYPYDLGWNSLPAGVRTIGLRAFNNCYALTTADLGACEGLTTLESYTFSECYSLTEVTLPASITTIEENAFINCEALKTVRFGGTEAQWNAIAVSEGNEALLNANIVFGG